MFNSKRKICKSLLAFGLISVTTVFTVASENPATAQSKPQPNIVKRFIDSIWKRHPTKSLGARFNVFPIAPGVINTSEIWHNQPMFLWHSASKNQPARLIVREQNSDTQWVQKVNVADRKAFYQGKPLQPGKIYQWKLEGVDSSIPWTNFRIMSEKQRAQINTDLQSLVQKKSLAGNTEDIAQRKAEYFINYGMKPLLWSDALQALYEVKHPSPDFIQNREELIDNISFGE